MKNVSENLFEEQATEVMENKRSSERVYLDIKAWIAYEGEMQHVAQSINISETGLSVMTSKKASLNSVCHLILDIRDRQTKMSLISLNAEVVHCRPIKNSEMFNIGMRFIEQDANLTRVIKSYIS